MFKKSLLVLFAVFVTSLSAGVNLKNGNYFISYTDLVIPGSGDDLKIMRTYNSKATERGWWGMGWGSDYETYLVTDPDGSVVVHENGSGAFTRFSPKGKIDPVKAAQIIVTKMRKSGKTFSESVAKNYIDKLAKDADLRTIFSRRYGVKSSIAKGSKLYSTERGYQVVTKMNDGYKREFQDGRKEFFNADGKLIKIQERKGYVIELDWSKKTKKLTKVSDSVGKQIFFEWYPSGRVKHVWGTGTKKALYKYDGLRLTESHDIAGNVYKYEYDSNYNLTKVSYQDGKKMEITYTPKTQFVSQIKKRTGEVVKYKYESNPKNPHYHYWTSVERKFPNRKPYKSKYEYEIKIRPDGSHYTYRIMSDVNGLVTENVYAEKNGLPLKIRRGKLVTNFDYNSDGLLVKKNSTNGIFSKLSYDKKWKKVSKVEDNNGWTSFVYDNSGNLSKALNSKGVSVILLYDRKGHIAKMVDYNKRSKEKRSLSFAYNSMGKPVEIAMDGTGKINVEYDNTGEIKRVESKKGPKMAAQVHRVLQSLIAMVRPAGVTLSL